jgi:enoyl-CoA hydratase/carnithine racemase
VLDLILTGREVDAYEAQRLGLVTRVVPKDFLDEETDQLLARLASLDAQTVRTTKRFLSEAQGMLPDQAARYGVSLLVNQMVENAT